MPDKDKEDYERRLKNILNNLGLSVKKYEDEEKTKESVQDHGELVEVQKEAEKKSIENLKPKQDISDDPKLSPVYLSWKAYKRMVGYALRYANKEMEQNEWREVYGVLIGNIEEKSEYTDINNLRLSKKYRNMTKDDLECTSLKLLHLKR